MSKVFHDVLMEEVPDGYYFAGLAKAQKGGKYYDVDDGWVDVDSLMEGCQLLLALPDIAIDDWANTQPMLVDFLRYVREGSHTVRLYGDGKHLLISTGNEVYFHAEPCPNKFRAKLIKVVNGRWAAG